MQITKKKTWLHVLKFRHMLFQVLVKDKISLYPFTLVCDAAKQIIFFGKKHLWVLFYQKKHKMASAMRYSCIERTKGVT